MRLGPFSLAPLAVLALFLLSAACSVPRTVQGNTPEMRMWNVKILSFHGPTQVSVGSAEGIAYDRDSADVSAHQASLTFLGKESQAGRPPGTVKSKGEPDSTLTAPLVTGALGARGVDGEGGVVATNTRGMVARTPRAHLDQVAGLVTGHEPIDIRGPTYAIRGRAFTFRLHDETYDVEGPVETVIGLPEGEGATP